MTKQKKNKNQPLTSDEIIKKITLDLIPLQDREVILEVVSGHLKLAKGIHTIFAFRKYQEAFLLTEMGNDQLMSCVEQDHSLINDVSQRSDINLFSELQDNIKKHLLNYLENHVLDSSCILPIHSFEELQAILDVVQPKNTSISEEDLNLI